MALSPAARFIVSVGGCARVSAEPVVMLCPVEPGVGPEPASLPGVLQGPACAIPTLRTIAAQPARTRCLVICFSLASILRRAASSAPLEDVCEQRYEALVPASNANTAPAFTLRHTYARDAPGKSCTCEISRPNHKDQLEGRISASAIRLSQARSPCATDLYSELSPAQWVPASRGAARRALHRVRDTAISDKLQMRPR
jgi:hypothetical protein